MTDVEEIYFLIELCPRMNIEEVNYINNMDIELFVRGVIMKTRSKFNHYLRLLCFCIPAVDDEMVQKLEQMINFEKLLFDYMGCTQPSRAGHRTLFSSQMLQSTTNRHSCHQQQISL